VTETHLFDTYARMPVAFERGEGVWLFDTEGRRYLDALSGIAVCSLGHAHPRLTDACVIKRTGFGTPPMWLTCPCKNSSLNNSVTSQG